MAPRKKDLGQKMTRKKLVKEVDSFGYPCILWTSAGTVCFRVDSTQELKAKLAVLPFGRNTAFFLQRSRPSLRRKSNPPKRISGVRVPSWKTMEHF